MLAAAGSITTLKETVRFEEVIKKSRFVGLAAPVTCVEEAADFVKKNSDLKARHNCFAWRLADGTMRSNGDGEPGGTAGPPILAAIDGAALSNVVVLVSRYRLGEGAKLGTGGLVRAYGGTAAQTLDAGCTVEIEPIVSLTVEYSLSDTGPVYSVLSSRSPRPVDHDDKLNESPDVARLIFDVPPALIDMVVEELRHATAGRAVILREDDGNASESDEKREEADLGGAEADADRKLEDSRPQAKETDTGAAAATLPPKRSSRRQGLSGKHAARDGIAKLRVDSSSSQQATLQPKQSHLTKEMEHGMGQQRPSACQQCGAATSMLFQDDADSCWYCTSCWKSYYDVLGLEDP